jgi:hypothetical protein
MAATTTNRRLPAPLRKALLSAHLITGVGLLGVDLTLVALAVSGSRGTDPASVYPAALLLGTWLLLPLAVGSWATGVGLGLLTPWGLIKHWWVTVKLAFNSIGLVLAVTVMHPTLVRLADAAKAGGAVAAKDQDGLMGATLGATTVLTLSVLLAVYKPFGRLRGRGTGRTARLVTTD